MKKRVAMVGAHDPATLDDCMRLASAQTHGWVGGFRDEELDLINLDYGRDFLKERKRYEAVIVHSVFHSNQTFSGYREQTAKLKELYPRCRQSPVHTVENWRRRLAATGAASIVVWEMIPCALSGWQLSLLDGYRIAHRDHRVTHYMLK
jgi:hypothetical protein